jgi:hypothetical protein
MAHNPKVPGSSPGRANMTRGSSMVERRCFFNDCRFRLEDCEYAGAECWPGLHPVKISVSANHIVGFQKDCWRMPAGVYGTR